MFKITFKRMIHNSVATDTSSCTVTNKKFLPIILLLFCYSKADELTFVK